MMTFDQFIQKYVEQLKMEDINEHTVDDGYTAYQEYVHSETNKHPKHSKRMNKDIFIGLVAANPVKTLDYLTKLLKLNSMNIEFFHFLNAIAHPQSLDALAEFEVYCLVGLIWYGPDKYLMNLHANSDTLCIPLSCSVVKEDIQQEYCVYKETDHPVFLDQDTMFKMGLHKTYTAHRMLITLKYFEFFKLFGTPCKEGCVKRLFAKYDIFGHAVSYKVIDIDKPGFLKDNEEVSM